MSDDATREDALEAVRKYLGQEKCIYDVDGLVEELHRQSGTWDISSFLDYPTRPGGPELLGRRFWASARPFKEVLEVCPAWCTSGPHRIEMTNDAGWPLTHHSAELYAGNGLELCVEQEVTFIDESVNVYLGRPRIAMYVDTPGEVGLDTQQAWELSGALDRAAAVLAAALADYEAQEEVPQR